MCIRDRINTLYVRHHFVNINAYIKDWVLCVWEVEIRWGKHRKSYFNNLYYSHLHGCSFRKTNTVIREGMMGKIRIVSSRHD